MMHPSIALGKLLVTTCHHLSSFVITFHPIQDQSPLCMSVSRQSLLLDVMLGRVAARHELEVYRRHFHCHVIDHGVEGIDLRLTMGGW